MSSDGTRLQAVLGNSRVRAALANSRVARVREWFGEAESGGEEGRSGRLRTVARGSWLYRRLTAEPAFEGVVVDLQETRLVGPVIGVLDAVVDRVTPYWRASRLHEAVAALVRVGDGLAERRGGRLLVRLLTPPRPDEEAEDRPER